MRSCLGRTPLGLEGVSYMQASEEAMDADKAILGGCSKWTVQDADARLAYLHPRDSEELTSSGRSIASLEHV